MANRTVLIITQWFDPTADYVVEELNNRAVELFRVDAAEFPQQLTFSAGLTDDGWSGALRTPRRRLPLENVCGIYYRRPASFVFPEGMSSPEQRWAHAEARLGFGGLLSALPHWMNHPFQIAQAGYKPSQLRMARRAGLLVPRTIVTNDPGAVHQFAESVGKVIYKPFSAGGISEAGKHKTIYAAIVSKDECNDPSIRLTAHLFQEWIEHDHAVRLTVVGSQFFAAAIYSNSPASYVDWRSDYESLSYAVTETPDQVKCAVTSLMNMLGLRFGALDFLVTLEGEWVFLEINPNGQWAWIEENTGLPIASAIADILVGDAT
jgi:ATP-grasp ribosomal peptide maturase